MTIRAGERNAEPELRDQQDSGRLDGADQHRRHRLADHDLERAERRHQQLVEGALLAFARHRHGGQHHVCISVSVPISAGIMFQRVSRLGLYQARLMT